MSKIIENSLDAWPIETVDDNNVVVYEQRAIDVTTENDGEEVYKHVKKNLVEAIDQGAKSIKEVKKLGELTENIRAYEAVGLLIRAVSDASKQLHDVSKEHNERNGSDNNTKSSNDGVTNNNVFVGSSSELLDLIKRTQDETSDDNV